MTKGQTVIKYTLKSEHTYIRYSGSSRYYIKVEAGTYEATGRSIDCVSERPLEEAYWVIASLPGVCVGGYVPCGDINDHIGDPLTHYVQSYGYAVREALARGSSCWSVVTEELEKV